VAGWSICEACSGPRNIHLALKPLVFRLSMFFLELHRRAARHFINVEETKYMGLERPLHVGHANVENYIDMTNTYIQVCRLISVRNLHFHARQK
jgi:hypothetical protein